MSAARNLRWTAVFFAVTLGSAVIVNSVQAMPLPVVPALHASSAAQAASLDKVKKDPEAIKLLPAEYRQSKKVIVGFDPVIPPMSYKGADGKPAGVEPAIVAAVAKVLDLKVEFLPASTDAAVAGLQSHRYDMAVGSYISNKPRQQYADIISYAKYGQGVATAPKNKSLTFETLCGHSVAVAKGNVQQTVMVPALTAKCKTAGQPALDEKVFPEESAIFLAVLSGRVDAALLNEVTIRYHAAQSKGRLVLAEGGYSTAPRGILIQKNGLADAVLRAIRDLASNGTLAQIFADAGLSAVAISQPELNITN
jgi:polar amino acid transport system substrate-binding protein